MSDHHHDAAPPYYTANLEVTRLWARSPEYRRDCETRAAKQAALLQATGWVGPQALNWHLNIPPTPCPSGLTGNPKQSET